MKLGMNIMSLDVIHLCSLSNFWGWSSTSAT